MMKLKLYDCCYRYRIYDDEVISDTSEGSRSRENSLNPVSESLGHKSNGEVSEQSSSQTSPKHTSASSR